MGIDLFDKPETLRKVWDRLVVLGFTLDYLDLGDTDRLADDEQKPVRVYMEALREATWQESSTVGSGTMYRATGKCLAAALVVEGKLLHVAFPSQVSDRSTNQTSQDISWHENQGLLTREDLENIGSLITIKGTNTCLGDLMHFDGHGTYDPDHGLVPVSKEEADTHNKLLDEARLKGLDENCEVGQGSFFYFTRKAPDRKVTTFVGTVVSTDVASRGSPSPSSARARPFGDGCPRTSTPSTSGGWRSRSGKPVRLYKERARKELKP